MENAEKRARIQKIFFESIFKFDSSPLAIATIILSASLHQTLAKDEHTDLHQIQFNQL
jgi:hypothetical protein